MRRTTCGETHKVEVVKKRHFKNFYDDEKDKFNLSFKSEPNCIYNNLKIIESSATNYINLLNTEKSNIVDEQLKLLLKKEFDECEKVYPMLGEVFINLFFEHKLIQRKNNFVFMENNYSSFLETIPDINAKNIVRWVIENASLERFVEIEKSYSKNIQIEKDNNIKIKVNYDLDFLGADKNLEVKNYRYAIIDGIIESVGEIHHLMHFAAKTKEPYIIFCFGMSDEVKHTIIKNNSKRVTQVIPVSITVDESSVNILNDIAVLHEGQIISALLGQTISQELRKELPLGQNIKFDSAGFVIKPTSSSINIQTHIRFLENRINNLPQDVNKEVIKERIKNLRNKTLKIYIPSALLSDLNFSKSLDYGLRALRFTKNNFIPLCLDGNRIYIPEKAYEFAKTKVNITKEMIYNVENVIVLK